MMKRNTTRLKYVLPGLFLLTVGSSYSQWRIVLDPRAVAQLEANTAMQLATEYEHNAQLDTILVKQEEIVKKTSAISAAKELTLQTLENIEGFGVESSYYKSIGKTAGDIIDNAPKVLKAIQNSGIENKLLMATKVGDLVDKTSQYVNDFVSIVSNAKVQNPIKSGISGKGDGHNLLDRYERLTVAISVYDGLKNVKKELNYMLFMAEYGTWADLIHRIDRRTWANLNSGKATSETLIRQWEKLTRK